MVLSHLLTPEPYLAIKMGRIRFTELSGGYNVYSDLVSWWVFSCP